MKFSLGVKQTGAILQPRQGDAGFDLLSSETFVINAGERMVVDTGVHIEPPVIHRLARRASKFLFGAELDYVGFVKPRSGLAAKHGIDVLAGVIDSSYRGAIGVILLNTGDQELVVQSGDKIAQIVFLLALVPTINKVPIYELKTTLRDGNGFGSTGRN